MAWRAARHTTAEKHTGVPVPAVPSPVCDLLVTQLLDKSHLIPRRQ